MTEQAAKAQNDGWANRPYNTATIELRDYSPWRVMYDITWYGYCRVRTSGTIPVEPDEPEEQIWVRAVAEAASLDPKRIKWKGFPELSAMMKDYLATVST
jgi:hypothetical protein